MEKSSLRVIVAEDEMTIRAVTADTLADAGFDVVEARDADAALALLDTQADHVDALFTDVTMPGSVNGAELAMRVSDQWPWIKLLVSSGASLAPHDRLPAGAQFLPKPYQLSKVPHQLRQLVLHETSAHLGEGFESPTLASKILVATHTGQ